MPPSWSAITGPVEALGRRLRRSATSVCVLPGYLEPLRRLLPLVPELADLDDEELRRAPARHGRARAQHRRRAARRDAPRGACSRSSASASSWCGRASERAALGCLVVFPQEDRPRGARAARAARRSASAALPDAFKRLSLRAAVEAMQRRLAELPEAIAVAEGEREALLLPHAARLDVLRAAIADELERLDCARPVRRDAARVRRRVLGTPARRSRACGARSKRGSEPPCSSRTSRPLRATRRRRC